MTKTVAIGIARMGSTRLPGKVLMRLANEPVIQWVTLALRKSLGIDDICIATSTLPADDVIAEWCQAHYVQCFRGSETDVLSRFYGAAKMMEADVVVRVTCDCPFLDPEVIGQVIRLRQTTNADYASNIDPPTWPDGLDVEALTFTALEAAHSEAIRPTDRDCVTRYIARNRSRFKSETLICPIPGMHKERWVLDTADDLAFCSQVGRMVKRWPPTHLDILSVLDEYPELRKLNAHHPRNERFYDAVATEDLGPRSFSRSQAILAQARSVIPLGAQTFSKSFVQYPHMEAPLYVSHGDGAYLFDVDGGDYVDLVGALCPVILGYRDPDVDEAIRRQLSSGITFSLSTELETELAEMLCRIIPCAEMVRLGKTGTDVTSAAVRLARAYTGQNHILLSGYHGWADWSIGTTERHLGTVETQYSQRFTYGDKQSLMTAIDENTYPLPGFAHKTCNVAGIIVEPDSDPKFLRWLRELCTQHGIVLIFDEVLTGFRYSLGGAQELYGVTPDLATFGKSMANGMPISAIVGKREIMKLMEPAPGRQNIFYSGTNMGETLSIAAAIATIKKMERENVIYKIEQQGCKLFGEVCGLLVEHNITDIHLNGHGSRIKINFTSDHIKTAFMREMIRNGVLVINSHNMMAAHDDAALRRVFQAYNRTLAAIHSALDAGTIAELAGAPIDPAANVRAYQRT